MTNMDDILKNLAETLEKEDSEKTEPPHYEPETEEYEEDFYEDSEEESEDFEEEEYEDDEEYDEDDYDDFDDDEEDRPRLKFPKVMKLVAIIAGALVVILAAAALWVNANFVMADGLHSRKAESLDLRDKNLSLQNYEKLARELPGCEILWNVPMGGTGYDCQAKSLTISGINPGEEVLFSQFTELESLDLTAVTITPEQFDAIQAKLPGCSIRWSIPIGGSRYASDAKEIALSNLSMGEIALFDYFEQLETVDANSCSNYDELLALYQAQPNLNVCWGVEIASKTIPQNTEELTFASDELTSGELLRALPLLPELKKVIINGLMDSDEQKSLMENFPQILFDWEISLCGKTFRSTDSTISFAEQAMTAEDLEEIKTNSFRFYNLEVIDLTNCGFDSNLLTSLRDDIGVEINWKFELYGIATNALAETIDLSNTPIGDISQLEQELSKFSRLKKIDLCNCGISTADMIALVDRHKDIRFVWELPIGTGSIRTDATAFFSSNFGSPEMDQLEYLRHCPDIVAMDLGHLNLTDLSFIREMPNLKYLIISCTPISDLSPLENHPSLITLEATSTNITDFSPLLTCTNLLDLNICSYGLTSFPGESLLSTLTQMTGLERLWFSHEQLDETQRNQLVSALPNTEIYCSLDKVSCMGGLWRYHERYYESRDLLGMWYMDENSDRVHMRVEDGKWVPDNEWFFTYVVGVTFPDNIDTQLGLDFTFTGVPLHLKFDGEKWSFHEGGYMEGYLNRP